MQPTKQLEWLLVVGCVVLCALFGVACSFGDDLGVSLRPADGEWCSPDDTFRAPPVVDGYRLLAGSGGRTDIAGPSLLAAVPGGLCLLI